MRDPDPATHSPVADLLAEVEDDGADPVLDARVDQVLHGIVAELVQPPDPRTERRHLRAMRRARPLGRLSRIRRPRAWPGQRPRRTRRTDTPAVRTTEPRPGPTP